MASRKNRIGELEDELKQRDARVKELRANLAKAEALVGEMREQIEDAGAVIDGWIEAFDMERDADGKWSWKPFVTAADDWYAKYTALVRDWNRFVSEYNAVIRPRNVGRPLGASEAQAAHVLKLRKAGTSLRGIVDETSLPLWTVRTIVDKGEGTDRTMVKHLQRIDPDRARTAAWRARKRTRDGLPKRINETLAKGRELVKEAKGLK
jgi:hypothetical protein